MFRLPQISLPKGRSVNIVLVITGILTALPLGPVLGAPVGRHAVRCDAKNDHVDINKYVPEPGTIFHDIYAGDLAAVDTRVKAHPALVKSLEAKTYFTPLHFAALDNKPDIAAFLIAHGADVNALHLHYATPLHLVARVGSLPVAKMLVSHGANLNVKDGDYGCSPLLVAALNDKTEMAEFLVGKGADLNIKTDDKFDVLYASSFHGNGPLVEFLLAKGMNIETTNAMGLTPLCVAVLNNHPSIVKILLDKGAKNRNAAFGSPYELATQGGRTDTGEILALLRAHGMAPPSNFSLFDLKKTLGKGFTEYESTIGQSYQSHQDDGGITRNYQGPDLGRKGIDRIILLSHGLNQIPGNSDAVTTIIVIFNKEGQMTWQQASEMFGISPQSVRPIAIVEKYKKQTDGKPFEEWPTVAVDAVLLDGISIPGVPMSKAGLDNPGQPSPGYTIKWYAKPLYGDKPELEIRYVRT